jgi:RNA polymerase sigma-70 factor (ECF subfamily)
MAMNRKRHDSSDEALVKRAQRGEMAAFGELIRRYQDAVFALTARMCRQRSIAEELAQEAFLKALEKIHQFRRESRFYTWLFRIATNMVLSHRRRATTVRFHAFSDGADSDDAPRGDQFAQNRERNPHDGAVVGEQQQAVAEALSEVDETFRIVLVLRDMQDLDYGEIAEILGIPVGTVKSRLFRARRELRARLQARGVGL